MKSRISVLIALAVAQSSTFGRREPTQLSRMARTGSLVQDKTVPSILPVIGLQSMCAKGAHEKFGS